MIGSNECGMKRGTSVKRGRGGRINREKCLAHRFFGRSTCVEARGSRLRLVELVERLENPRPIVVREIVLDDVEEGTC